MAQTKTKQNCCRLSVAEEIRRLKPYVQGLTDTEIAKELNLRREVITQWRTNRGLPANKERKKHYGPKLVKQCQGCVFVNLEKNICNAVTEPGWFWQDGKVCSFRKEGKNA